MLVDGLVESNRVIWPTHRTWGIITMFAHRRNLMPTLRSSPRTSALLLLLATPVVTQGQVRQGLCSDGFGVFQTSFFGVKVTVGAAKKEGFATRACSATLEWGKNSLPVVPEAAAVDIDALGVDLGLESPIVALQVKNSDADWFVTYKIYSLEKPPRLLRIVSGGSSFSAADTDSCRVSPPFTTRTLCENFSPRIASSSFAIPSPRVATMMSVTSSHDAIRRKLNTTIGTPSNSKNCFGVSAPIRVPRPAAGKIAAIRLILGFELQQFGSY